MLHTLAWTENEVRYYSITAGIGIGETFPNSCRKCP